MLFAKRMRRIIALVLIISSMGIYAADAGDSQIETIKGVEYTVRKTPALGLGKGARSIEVRDRESDERIAYSHYIPIKKSNSSTLEVIYVYQRFRRKGLGRYLFDQNVEYARQDQKEKLIWQVCPFQPYYDEQEPEAKDDEELKGPLQAALAFFKGSGGKIREGQKIKHALSMPWMEYIIKERI